MPFRIFSARPSFPETDRVTLVIGLGNPGQPHAHDRHNIGFMCINHFARAHGIALDKKKADARAGLGRVAGVGVVLAKPQTYMNASGKAVIGLMKKFRTGIEDLIVIQDDLDLPLGRIRVRKGGSSGGHKGIESIIRETGGADFVRVRIGIGRPAKAEATDSRKRDVVDHVLAEFTFDERQIIDGAIRTVGEVIECILLEGVPMAMNRYNTSASQQSGEREIRPLPERDRLEGDSR